MDRNLDKKLIRSVKETMLNSDYPFAYQSIRLTLDIWDEIAKNLHSTALQCKKRWKALRDRYAREKRGFYEKRNKKKKNRKTWELMDELSFLDFYYQPRNKEENEVEKVEVQNNILAGEIIEDENFEVSERVIHFAVSDSNGKVIGQFECDDRICPCEEISSAMPSSNNDTVDTWDELLHVLTDAQPMHAMDTASSDTTSSSFSSNPNKVFMKAATDIITTLNASNQIKARAYILSYLSKLQLMDNK
ncbi:uncharacterized protein LOC119683203 [Teleopsis dalmanni]|uniref:uncharacterized protein LOC119683203 n=1 Tax=Teleopsis dalmanni TaxID=139649 RepID=UPI000D32AFDB|nr:uncharacterized protein LOC119683203 [Teleopsis dalmanni]